MSCKGLQVGSMSQLINQKDTNMPSIQKVLINTSKGMIIYCNVSHHCKRLKGILQTFSVEKEPGNFMTECSKCREWYHRKCEVIPKEVFIKPNTTWECSFCL